MFARSVKQEDVIRISSPVLRWGLCDKQNDPSIKPEHMAPKEFALLEKQRGTSQPLPSFNLSQGISTNGDGHCTQRKQLTPEIIACMMKQGVFGQSLPFPQVAKSTFEDCRGQSLQQARTTSNTSTKYIQQQLSQVRQQIASPPASQITHKHRLDQDFWQERTAPAASASSKRKRTTELSMPSPKPRQGILNHSHSQYSPQSRKTLETFKAHIQQNGVGQPMSLSVWRNTLKQRRGHPIHCRWLTPRMSAQQKKYALPMFAHNEQSVIQERIATDTFAEHIQLEGMGQSTPTPSDLLDPSKHLAQSLPSYSSTNSYNPVSFGGSPDNSERSVSHADIVQPRPWRPTPWLLAAAWLRQ